MIIKRKLYSKISGFPRVARNIRYKLGRKSPKAAKKAITLGRKAERAGAYLRTSTPEQLTGDFGSFSFKHPVQAGMTVATWPASGAAVEGVLQKFKPYKEVTKWTGTQYERYLRKPVEGITKTVINMPW